MKPNDIPGFAPLARIPLILLFGLGLFAPPAAARETTFEAIFRPYDTARLALAHDDLAAARTAARKIATIAQDAAHAAGHATSRAKALPPCCQPLPEIARSAADVAKAQDLAKARTAFGRVSASLIRYRRAQGLTNAFEVVCPVEHKSWLQRDRTIGNPYLGSTNPSCGTAQNVK